MRILLIEEPNHGFLHRVSRRLNELLFPQVLLFVIGKDTPWGRQSDPMDMFPLRHHLLQDPVERPISRIKTVPQSPFTTVGTLSKEIRTIVSIFRARDSPVPVF